MSATVDGWNLGLTICYDVRFPDLYRALRAPHRILPDVHKDSVDSIASSLLEAGVQRGGAQVMLVPAAFTPKTGESHWEILLRTRAIETQSYVIAAAQAGQHNLKRTSHGHSLIIDPWGTVGKIVCVQHLLYVLLISVLLMVCLVARLGEEREGICYASLNRPQLRSVRENMPVEVMSRLVCFRVSLPYVRICKGLFSLLQTHRRPDVY